MNIEQSYLDELHQLIEQSDSEPAFTAIIVKDGSVVASSFAHHSRDSDHELLLIHAEEATLLQALRDRIDLAGADLYVLGMRASGEVRYTDKSYCCVVCSRLLSQTTIRYIYFPTLDGWSRLSVTEMYAEAVARIT